MIEETTKGHRETFNQREVAIRDCYDAFLDGLERFSRYARTGLVDITALRPYIGYWIDDIHAPTNSQADAAWSAALLTYISFYRFGGVLWLFKEFGCDISPSSTAYLGFLKGMEDPLPCLRRNHLPAADHTANPLRPVCTAGS